MLRSLLLIALASLSSAAFSPAQVGREAVRLDTDGVSDAYFRDNWAVVADGDLRVATWTNLRDFAVLFHEQVWIAVSTDGGVTWGPEILAHDAAVSSGYAMNVQVEVANGVIYLCFWDRIPGTLRHSAILKRSTDLGANWTETVMGDDFTLPRMFVDGDNVLFLMLDNTNTTNELYARWSEDQGATFTPAVEISGNPIRGGEFTGCVDGDDAYVFWADRPNLAEPGIWTFSKSVAGGSWDAPLPVDQDFSNIGEPRIGGRFAAANGRLHAIYQEAERFGSGFFEAQVLYAMSDDGGLTWTETLLCDPLADTTDLDLVAVGDQVGVCWIDETDYYNSKARARVSSDGGSSFAPEFTVPDVIGPGSNRHTLSSIGYANGRFVLAFGSAVYTPFSSAENPAYCVTIDDGNQWLGPFELARDLEASEDIDTTNSGWALAGDSLSAVWDSDGSYSAKRSAIFGGGIRFPFINAIDNGNRTVTFELGAATPVSQPSYARWAASSVTGVTPHPENPQESLGLGASFELNYTLGRATQFAAAIAADGSAALTFPVGNLTGTYYVQGWVNVGPSVTGGTAPSDVVPITL